MTSPTATPQKRVVGALSRVLRHPAARRLKRVLRDWYWRVKGRGIRNPPLPAGVRSVLFVCLGNICRSPFAGLIAARRLSEAGLLGTHSASAGIRTTQSGRSPREARAVAATYHVSLEDHRPQMLTRTSMDAYDLIVVMEGRQLDLLRSTYPDAADRIVLLSLFDDEASGYTRYNIEDPFDRPLAEYEECYRRIDRAVRALVAALQARERVEPGVP